MNDLDKALVILLEEKTTSLGDEVASLRQRVKNQRAELRRLNKVYGALWAGWRRGTMTADTTNLRGKMNDAFGVEAVRKAEHGEQK